MDAAPPGVPSGAAVGMGHYAAEWEGAVAPSSRAHDYLTRHVTRMLCSLYRVWVVETTPTP